MRRARFLSWAFPLAVGAGLLSLDIAQPWTGSFDANSALFSTAARNTLRYGLVATRAGQVVNGGDVPPARFRFYAHHPPGLPLTMAVSFALLGVHEWSARLVPILFTLGAAMLLWAAAREMGGLWAGLFAALVFVVQPMIAFYGRMPDHEAPAAFFAMLLAVLTMRWLRSGRRGWLAALCIAAFVGLWYAWVVFVVPWLLLAHCALTRRRGWAWMLLPAGAAAAGLGTVVCHLAAVQGGFGELWRALAYRSGSRAGDRWTTGSFGLLDLLGREGEYFSTGFSLVAGALAVAWAVGLGRRRGADALLVAALAFFALFNIFAFKQGAYVHIYYEFYLGIPLALAAGLALGGRGAMSRPWAALAGVLALAVVAEGWVKLERIRAPRFYEDQLAVARFVREESSPADHVLVIWDQRSSFRQLIFYADRDIAAVPDRAEAGQLAEREHFDVVVETDGKESRVIRLEPSAPARAPGQ